METSSVTPDNSRVLTVKLPSLHTQLISVVSDYITTDYFSNLSKYTIKSGAHEGGGGKVQMGTFLAQTREQRRGGG